jgi:hypothetical protein
MTSLQFGDAEERLTKVSCLQSSNAFNASLATFFIGNFVKAVLDLLRKRTVLDEIDQEFAQLKVRNLSKAIVPTSTGPGPADTIELQYMMMRACLVVPM